jgi:hypothetical protein
MWVTEPVSECSIVSWRPETRSVTETSTSPTNHTEERRNKKGRYEELKKLRKGEVRRELDETGRK